MNKHATLENSRTTLENRHTTREDLHVTSKNKHPTGESRHTTRESEMLRHTRMYLGYSQLQVATMADMQIRQYQRLEYGEREVFRVNLRTGLLLCAVLELDPMTLIFGEKPDTLIIQRPAKGKMRRRKRK